VDRVRKSGGRKSGRDGVKTTLQEHITGNRFWEGETRTEKEGIGW
jgi:hypothetical protein